ncbi:MAG: cyclodeaminase/cyclohydrolase family protein [Thermodesulfobacteriota bacterium]
MLANLKITEFIDQVGGDTAVPGGGSVAALSGALAAGLTRMVANLTVGREKYAVVEPEMKAIVKEAAELQEQLTADIDRDSAAYTGVMDAFKMAKATDAEKTARARAIQVAMKHAAAVPLAVARHAFRVLELTELVVQRGNKNAVTDGAVGAMLARTAVLAALYNVKINLSTIRDKDFVKKTADAAAELEDRTAAKEKEILTHVVL